MFKYLVGIDEAGRGPLAGPVAVAAVVVPINANLPRDYPGITDSKQLSEERREELHELLHGGQTATCTFIPPQTIDRHGMSEALRRGVGRSLKKLAVSPHNTLVKLDGTLYAPREFSQETIVKGDVSEAVISSASIIAKVERDRRMKRYARRWPQYGFERHKGYGTQQHREAIRKYGVCPIHRERFLSRISESVSRI